MPAFTRFTRTMDLRRNKPRPYGVGVESLGYAEGTNEDFMMGPGVWTPASSPTQQTPSVQSSGSQYGTVGYGTEFAGQIEWTKPPTQTTAAQPAASSGASVDIGKLIGGITTGLMSTINTIAQGELLRKQLKQGAVVSALPSSGGGIGMAGILIGLVVLGGGAYLLLRKKG